ncbi:MAG: cysteine desulfurase, partial [Pedosphaera sp.]|nr:cysteine desulfurase [Pedosphaera sp.]
MGYEESVRTIYLDYNSTTPLDASVREKMEPFLAGEFGNPSSLHSLGRRARAALDEARDRIARVLKCSGGELIFSSGGTESNNLAIFGAARALREKGRHIIISSVEHPSVLGPCEYLLDKEGFSVSKIPVDRFGLVSPTVVSALIRPDTILVSVMAANNVVGTIQPVQRIGEICRSKGVLFHSDASQWFGKLPVDSVHSFNADLVSFCSHKFHGPKGAGALFVRSQTPFSPCLAGGPQENERRPGTENVAACVGMAEAVERFVAAPVFSSPFVRSLSD